MAQFDRWEKEVPLPIPPNSTPAEVVKKEDDTGRTDVVPSLVYDANGNVAANQMKQDVMPEARPLNWKEFWNWWQVGTRRDILVVTINNIAADAHLRNISQAMIRLMDILGSDAFPTLDVTDVTFNAVVDELVTAGLWLPTDKDDLINSAMSELTNRNDQILEVFPSLGVINAGLVNEARRLP